ncbi:MAG: hypothetical protein ACUVV0_09135 [Anaerolineae bacterium]
MHTVVVQISVDELKKLIQDAVEQKLLELLGDPDWGLELREEIQERLKRSFTAEEQGERGIPAEEDILQDSLSLRCYT